MQTANISQSNSRQKDETSAHCTIANGLLKKHQPVSNATGKNYSLSPLNRKGDCLHARTLTMVTETNNYPRNRDSSQPRNNPLSSSFSQSFANPTVTRTNQIPVIRTVVNSGPYRRSLVANHVSRNLSLLIGC